MRLLLITGLPGSGKSVLAHCLARRYGVLLLSKDLIKEPLLDVLGAGDAAHSKQLSDASFAALFAVARQAMSAGLDIILEGNFRPGEHETPLRGIAAAHIVQVLCRVAEPARRARASRGAARIRRAMRATVTAILSSSRKDRAMPSSSYRESG